MEWSEGEHFVWERKKKVFGPGSFFFLNTPKSSIHLIGSQDASPQSPGTVPCSASHQLGVLRSHRTHSASAVLAAGRHSGPCHLKYFPACFAWALRLWEIYELKQSKQEHLLLRNASKIITCPTSTLCSEMIS